ncbi:MAG: RHS repeat domain-containing protein, partial [bacterium]
PESRPAIDQVVHLMRTPSGSSAAVAAEQITRYEFGVRTAPSDNSTPSLLDSNDLLASIRYPNRDEPAWGAPSPTDKVVMAYDRLGQLRSKLDQRGVRHSFTYDAAGRLKRNGTELAVGNLDVDSWMDAIELAYGAGDGRLEFARSKYGSTVVNAVQFEYDALGRLTKFRQNPVGDVSGAGAQAPTTKLVEYSYAPADAATGNFARPSNIWYPSTPQTATTPPTPSTLGIDYGPEGSLNSRVSRPRAITVGGAVGGGTAVQYSYLGLTTPVVVDYPTPDIQLDYSVSHNGSSSATAYPALDTFGRTRRILWNDGTFAPGTITGEPNRPPLVELAYAFDQASNLVQKTDGRSGASRKRDEQYTLDGLMRLLKARRGTLAATDEGALLMPAPGTQRYQYDFVGNIRSTEILARVDENAPANPADRKLNASFNAVNEQANYVEQTGGSSGPAAKFAITHDAAGNVRTRETVAGGNRLAYRHDRWGRVTEVKFEIGSGSSDRAR